LKAFENRVLRGMFGPKGEEVEGVGKDYIMRNFIIYTLHQILIR
jgi:hypothetical protein